MVPSSLTPWLLAQQFGPVAATYPVGGGCINNGTRITTESGKSFFLKTNAHCPTDMFMREAEGLEALAVLDGPRVPQVFLYGEDFLLMEDLRPAQQRFGYWERLGEQLAAMHNHIASRFGFPHDNYIGSTPQPNPLTEDGFFFFAQNRLLYQAELAGSHGLLSYTEVQKVEHFAVRLSEWIPVQPASLVHGDLWSGNLITDDQGYPVLIDPATHYGWAEADLGMMTLFGSPPERFFHAYQEVRPLSPGLEVRFPVYNLYHLLNHLNLFGLGYYGQVMAIIRSKG
ncbi:MAG: fructosamine kinase family protein [Anaerolineales bacterium]|nr:fructosamine kinase family protein [Anaerolineales bacterium]